MYEISCSGTFEAAHYMDSAVDDSAYRRVHGHSFIVTVTAAAGALHAEHGWVMDMGQLQRALDAVLARLDHSLLNDAPDLGQPTMENLLAWIDRQLRANGVRAARLDIERPTIRQKATFHPPTS